MKSLERQWKEIAKKETDVCAFGMGGKQVNIINNGKPVMSGKFMKIKDMDGNTTVLCPDTVENLREFFGKEFVPAEFPIVTSFDRFGRTVKFCDLGANNVHGR